MSPTHGTPRQPVSPHTSPQRLPHLPTCHRALSISFTDREASARSRDNCPQSTDEQTEGGSHTADEGRCHFGVPLLSGPGEYSAYSPYWKDGAFRRNFQSAARPLSLCISVGGGYTVPALSVQLSNDLSSY